LEDILITGFIDWHKGLPSQSHGLRCNEIMYVQNVYDCTKIQWALLSPIMEVSYLSSLDWRDAAQKVKNSYRKNQNVHLSKYVEINRFDHSF
jgi:hypothetical protein